MDAYPSIPEWSTEVRQAVAEDRRLLLATLRKVYQEKYGVRYTEKASWQLIKLVFAALP